MDKETSFFISCILPVFSRIIGGKAFIYGENAFFLCSLRMHNIGAERRECFLLRDGTMRILYKKALFLVWYNKLD